MKLDYLNTIWRILVIDDSRLNRAVIKKTLSQLNMEVDEASDGMEGLEKFESSEYDLVLVDIIMPNLDGFGFLARFKELPGDDYTPVILMTGSDDLNSKIKGLQIGADDFLLKPLNEKELVARVLSLLRLKKVNSELLLKNIQIKKEMEAAKKVQEFIIPKDFSSFRYPKISGRYLPIEDIGGDYFDCYVLPSSRYGFLIADVTGHGIPAALVMTMSKMIFSIYAPRFFGTKDFFELINSKLRNILLDTQYISAFYIIYDDNTKTIHFTNAGHTRTLYYRSSKKSIIGLDTEGFFIGISDQNQYQEKSLSVETEDRLLMYTDGITELTNNKNEEFGETNLARCIKKNNNQKGDAFCEALLNDLRSFASLENRKDDIAFLNIEF